MNIDTYFAYENLSYFDTPEKYWKWLTRSVDRASANKIMQMFTERSRGNYLQESKFYDFFANLKNDLILLNYEYELLHTIGLWVEQHIPDHGTIIEFGCNTGLLTLYYALNRPGAKIIGIDNSSGAIEQANRRAGNYKAENIAFLFDDVTTLDPEQFSEVTCIISGRVFTELLTPKMRLRKSSTETAFEAVDHEWDLDAKRAIGKCDQILSEKGKLLVSERLPDYDRFDRLQKILNEHRFTIDQGSMQPIVWSDVNGKHYSRLFSAVKDESTKIMPMTSFPFPTKTLVVDEDLTQITFNGLFSYQLWSNFLNKNILDSGKIQWPDKKEIAYEIGKLENGLHYTYVSSNTDINMLSIYVSYEFERAKRELEDYLNELQKSGKKV